jgi:hypothetical protein
MNTNARNFSLRKYGLLPQVLKQMLSSSEPSLDGDVTYYPCSVLCRNGMSYDTVYIVNDEDYIRSWGVYPEDDHEKQWLLIKDLLSIKDSPMRLPPKFANELYKAGESGMGFTVFTVTFTDGSRQAYMSGNAIDFISYPLNKVPGDVVAVIPHEGRDSGALRRAPTYYWCLYSSNQP